MSISDFLTIIGVLIGVFALGYTIGVRDGKNEHKK